MDLLIDIIPSMQWVPPCDIVQCKDDLCFLLDVPGLTKGDLTINLEEGNIICIKGKDPNRSKSDGNYLCKERPSMDFETRYVLPDFIDFDKLNAQLQDGVLKLHFPMKEFKSKKISIE